MSSRSVPDPIYVLRGASSPVSALTFDLSGQLWSGGLDGCVQSWNMATRRSNLVLDAHHGLSVVWIGFLDTAKMVTQGRDGFVHLWSLQQSKWTQTGSTQANQQGFCAGCILDTDGGRSVLAIPGREISQIDIVDVCTSRLLGRCVPRTEKDLGMCMAIAKAGRDCQIVTGYEDGTLALWDTRTFKIVDKMSAYTDSVMCLDYCTHINMGIAGSVDDLLVTFSLTSDNKMESVRKVKVTNPGLNQTRFRNDGKLFVTGGWDSNVRLFSAKSLTPLAVLTYHKESVQALAFSHDNILACGSKDKHISLWDIYT